MKLNRYMDIGEDEIVEGSIIYKHLVNSTESYEVVEVNGDLGVEDSAGTFIALSDPFFDPKQLEGGVWILLSWFLDNEVSADV